MNDVTVKSFTDKVTAAAKNNDIWKINSILSGLNGQVKGAEEAVASAKGAAKAR